MTDTTIDPPAVNLNGGDIAWVLVSNGNDDNSIYLNSNKKRKELICN
jgi:hypothetical protein